MRAGVVLLLGGAKSRFPHQRRSLVRAELSKRRGDLEGDLAVVGHRKMANAAYRDVAHSEIRMVDSRVPAGHDDMVEVAVEGDKPGRTGCGFGEFVEQSEPGASWRTNGSACPARASSVPECGVPRVISECTRWSPPRR